MAKKKNTRNREMTAEPATALSASIQDSVLQNIRLHARRESQMEICGVLLGSHAAGRTQVIGSIKGEGAAQGDAHVTFTQETWVKIHEEKDAKYPDEMIVGWYHSHPGFGVFLSDHDLFIHKNFFSQPGQLAWVFDPHSDEEGCFGWENGDVRRVKRIEVVSDVEHEPIDRTEPSVIPEKKDSASKSAEETFFGEFTRDLMLIGSGLLLGAVMAFVWVSSSLPVGTRHVIENVERLQPFAVQLGDGRQLVYTPRLVPPQGVANGDNQLMNRLMNPTKPGKQTTNPMEPLMNLANPETPPSADNNSAQTGGRHEQPAR